MADWVNPHEKPSALLLGTIITGVTVLVAFVVYVAVALLLN